MIAQDLTLGTESDYCNVWCLIEICEQVMRSPCCKVFFFSIVAMLFSGCAAVYPKQNKNVLGEPVDFSYRHLVNPQLTKDLAIAEAKAELQRKNLLSDKYVSGAFDEYAPKYYERLISELPKNELDFILSNLEATFSEPAINYMLRGKYVPVKFKLMSIELADKGNGDFEANIKINADSFRYFKNSSWNEIGRSTFDANFLGTYTSSNGVVKGEFSNFDYVLTADIMYMPNKFTPSPTDIVLLDEKSISPILKSFSATAKVKEVDLVRKMVNNFASSIPNRYFTSSAEEYQKFEKKYKIDFASAKARLQRALGAFKYDDEKSTFNFDQRFYKGNESVLHKFSISLFPDRAGTVVQFSGKYQHIGDRFGGPISFGSDVYADQINSYADKVAELLNK